MADFAHGVNDALEGKTKEAEADFQQMEQNYPSLAEPSVNLAIVLRGAGDLEGASAALQRATTRAPDYALAWNELGLVRRSLGKFDDARMAYGKAISNGASYAPTHRNLGVLLDLYMQDPTTALAEFEHIPPPDRGRQAGERLDRRTTPAHRRRGAAVRVQAGRSGPGPGGTVTGRFGQWASCRYFAGALRPARPIALPMEVQNERSTDSDYVGRRGVEPR